MLAEYGESRKEGTRLQSTGKAEVKHHVCRAREKQKASNTCAENGKHKRQHFC